MRKSGKRGTAGFSLVETIVAIAILGLLSAPICASLLLAGRINARSRAVLDAQLAVRTTVETLMESGIPEDTDSYETEFPGMKIEAVKESGDESLPYYTVTVSDGADLVTVETYIHAAPSVQTPEGGEGG